MIQLNGVVQNFMPDLSMGKKEDLAKIVKISIVGSGFFFQQTLTNLSFWRF
jgi:hypothetical protein